MSASSKGRAGGRAPAHREGERSDGQPRDASVVGFGQRETAESVADEGTQGPFDLEAILKAVRETA
ncbi:MAG: hypothetical protein ACXWJ4_05435 [Methyloceanibacter sp.]